MKDRIQVLPANTRQREESEEATKRLPRTASFFHQENISEQHNTQNIDLREETSNSTSVSDVNI
jgi:hypothetical protein